MDYRPNPEYTPQACDICEKPAPGLSDDDEVQTELAALALTGLCYDCLHRHGDVRGAERELLRECSRSRRAAEKGPELSTPGNARPRP